MDPPRRPGRRRLTGRSGGRMSSRRRRGGCSAGLARRPRSRRSTSHSNLSSVSVDHWRPPPASMVAKPWTALRSARRAWVMSAGARSWPRRTAVKGSSSLAAARAGGSSGPAGSRPRVAAYRPERVRTKSRSARAAARKASRPAQPSVAAPTAAAASSRAALQRLRSSGLATCLPSEGARTPTRAASWAVPRPALGMDAVRKVSTAVATWAGNCTCGHCPAPSTISKGPRLARRSARMASPSVRGAAQSGRRCPARPGPATGRRPAAVRRRRGSPCHRLQSLYSARLGEHHGDPAPPRIPVGRPGAGVGGVEVLRPPLPSSRVAPRWWRMPRRKDTTRRSLRPITCWRVNGASSTSA